MVRSRRSVVGNQNQRTIEWVNYISKIPLALVNAGVLQVEPNHHP
jgi:hypothetical protein